MNNKHIFFAIGALFLLIILSNSIYILDQRQTALTLQLGEPIDYDIEPGLKARMPFIQEVIFFDKRVQNLAADTTEVIAADQKTMRVDAFTKYRIIDGLKFYQTAKDERGFKQRLAPILDSSLRQVLGSKPFKILLSPERSAIMLKIREILNAEAKGFGVQIVDVRITRADLPDKSREAVYDRMKSDREKEAKEIRAEGGEHAQIISSTAEKEKMIILAEAKKKAEIIRGQGDAEAIKTFAQAFNRDPEFYDFYRTMLAYRNSIKKSDTRVILSPDSEFFKYFKKGN